MATVIDANLINYFNIFKKWDNGEISDEAVLKTLNRFSKRLIFNLNYYVDKNVLNNTDILRFNRHLSVDYLMKNKKKIMDTIELLYLFCNDECVITDTTKISGSTFYAFNSGFWYMIGYVSSKDFIVAENMKINHILKNSGYDL